MLPFGMGKHENFDNFPLKSTRGMWKVRNLPKNSTQGVFDAHTAKVSHLKIGVLTKSLIFDTPNQFLSRRTSQGLEISSFLP